MPRLKGHMPPAKQIPARALFQVSSTIDGYEVVDQAGRAMTNSYPHANVPLQVAADLNDAARRGIVSLARALGCIEDDDVLEAV